MEVTLAEIKAVQMKVQFLEVMTGLGNGQLWRLSKHFSLNHSNLINSKKHSKKVDIKEKGNLKIQISSKLLKNWFFFLHM